MTDTVCRYVEYEPYVQCGGIAEFGIILPSRPHRMFVRCNAHAVSFVGMTSEWAIAPIDEAAGMQDRMINEKDEKIFYDEAYETAYAVAHAAVTSIYQAALDDATETASAYLEAPNLTVGDATKRLVPYSRVLSLQDDAIRDAIRDASDHVINEVFGGKVYLKEVHTAAEFNEVFGWMFPTRYRRSWEGRT